MSKDKNMPDNIIVEVDKMENAIGDKFSSRIPIKMRGENGETVNGFFTANNYVNAKKQWNNFLGQLKSQPQNEAFKPVIEKLQKLPVEYIDGMIADAFPKITRRNANIDVLGRNTTNESFFLAPLGFKEDERDALVNTPGFGDFMVNFLRGGFTLRDKQETFIQLQEMEEDGKITNRNNMMFEVADKLNMGSLIAKSVNMSVKNGDSVIHGTFMNFAEGVSDEDLENRVGLDNRKVEITAEGYAAISKLQIIDFICNNIDRHEGNMFFQLDTGDPNAIKLTGVQGIDNDASFGKGVHTGSGTTSHMSNLKDIHFITPDMKQALQSFSPEDIENLMRENNMGAGEIEAAKSRIELLKNAVEKGDIKEIQPEEFLKPENQKTALGDKSNIFEKVQYVVKTSNKSIGKTIRKAPDSKKEISVNFLRTDSEKLQFNRQYKDLLDVKSQLDATGSRMSPEFKNMYDSLNQCINHAKKMSENNGIISDNDMNLQTELLGKLNKACRDYKNLKSANPFTSSGKQRLHLANNLISITTKEKTRIQEDTVKGMNIKMKDAVNVFKSNHEKVKDIFTTLKNNREKPNLEEIPQQLRTLNEIMEFCEKTDVNLPALYMGAVESSRMVMEALENNAKTTKQKIGLKKHEVERLNGFIKRYDERKKGKEEAAAEKQINTESKKNEKSAVLH